MSWFFIAFISTLLWSATNFIDKYLISRYFKERGIAVLMIFSALIGLVLLPFIWIFSGGRVFDLGSGDIFILVGSGVLYVFAILPYFFALRREDASLVVPFFQSIPVFSYFLGLIFLGENLSAWQIFASILIISGAVGLSLDISGKMKMFRFKTFSLMMLSSFMYALNIFMFKFMEKGSDFWTVSFWEYSGFSLAAIALLTVSKWRRQMIDNIKEHGWRALGLNSINEVVNIIAKMIFNFATLLAPLALVWAVNGAQPLVVLVFGFVLTLLWPKIFKEDISRRKLAQKAIFIILIFIGGFMLNR
jgi:transporter family protein